MGSHPLMFSRQLGQLWEKRRLSSRHWVQKVWPQGVRAGRMRVSRQMGQFSSSLAVFWRA